MKNQTGNEPDRIHIGSTRLASVAQALRQPTSNPELPLARFRLIFRSSKPVAPNWFPGSAWRGVLGHELQARACSSAGCQNQKHAPDCRYRYLFETTLSSGKFTDSGTVPHPFVLSVPWRTVAPSGIVVLHLSLFGHAVSDAGLILDALRHGARRLQPIGPLDLVSMEEEAEPGSGIWRLLQQRPSPNAGPVSIPPAPATVRISLSTPLRLRIQNQEITAAKFRVAHLFSNLLRRVSLLTAHHTDTPLETDFAALSRMAERISFIRKELSWYDMARYSSRQDDLVPIGGLLGTFEFSLCGFKSLWPYFWLGQFTHAGKGTALGLGHYQVWTV